MNTRKHTVQLLLALLVFCSSERAVLRDSSAPRVVFSHRFSISQVESSNSGF